VPPRADAAGLHVAAQPADPRLVDRLELRALILPGVLIRQFRLAARQQVLVRVQRDREDRRRAVRDRRRPERDEARDRHARRAGRRVDPDVVRRLRGVAVGLDREPVGGVGVRRLRDPGVHVPQVFEAFSALIVDGARGVRDLDLVDLHDRRVQRVAGLVGDGRPDGLDGPEALGLGEHPLEAFVGDLGGARRRDVVEADEAGHEVVEGHAGTGSSAGS
jgi:hypothetical protein